jgi:hypothetical protein
VVSRSRLTPFVLSLSKDRTFLKIEGRGFDKLSPNGFDYVGL